VTNGKSRDEKRKDETRCISLEGLKFCDTSLPGVTARNPRTSNSDRIENFRVTLSPKIQ